MPYGISKDSVANFRKKRVFVMGKRSLLAAFLVVISIFAILAGSSFATAAAIIGGGALPEGCKKSYCADTILDTDLGEECVPG